MYFVLYKFSHKTLIGKKSYKHHEREIQFHCVFFVTFRIYI